MESLTLRAIGTQPAVERCSGPRHVVRVLCDLLKKPHGESETFGNIVSRFSRLTLEELDELSDRLAIVLRNHQVHKSDRVVVLLPSSVEFVIACFAIWKVGAICVPSDPAVRSAFLTHTLQETQPVALLVNHDFEKHLGPASTVPPSLKTFFVKGPTSEIRMPNVTVKSLDQILASTATRHLQPVSAMPDDVVSVTYTSGSAGTPKGVMHTHESWLAAAAFTRDEVGLSPEDKMLIPLPLHHAYAFRQIIAYLLAGGTVVIAADVYEGLKLLPEERPSALLLVPAACNILIDHFASILGKAAATLRYVEVGTAPTDSHRLDALSKLLPTTKIYLPYGLTEARVGFLKTGPDRLSNRIGPSLPGLSIDVVDQSGRRVANGEVGEIVLKGQGLMKGYWGHPETEKVLKQEGFRTGDLGRLESPDEIALLGRVDNVLKIGGRKVSPIEVETVLNQYPQVAESAVTGRPDPRGILETELHAFVVLHKGAKIKDEVLIEHCQTYLEPYKVPTRIHLVSSLPKSSVGKVQRHVLTEGTFESKKGSHENASTD